MAPVSSHGLNSDYEGIFPGDTMEDLEDGRLLAVGSDPTGYISEDVGRTWSPPFRLMQGSVEMEGAPMRDSIRRLSDGTLGMVYSKKDSQRAGTSVVTWYFASSKDEGRTWEDSSQIDITHNYDLDKGIFPMNLWGNMIQLSEGRLLVSGYWQYGGRNPGMPPTGPDPVTALIRGRVETRVADGHTYEAAIGGCYTYYSDDFGSSWSRCTGNVMVWPLESEGGIGGFGPCFEPVLIELKDGRVAMYVRTVMGRMFRSVSENSGEHWTLAEPTNLSSGDVPCRIGRLRTTGDILAVWNQSSAQEIDAGYSRGRLSVALSRDEGETWGNHHTVALSGGMDDVALVEPTPIRHQRAKRNMGVLPDDFARNDYPLIFFSKGSVIIKYAHTGYTDRGRQLEHRIVVVPEERLYD